MGSDTPYRSPRTLLFAALGAWVFLVVVWLIAAYSDILPAQVLPGTLASSPPPPANACASQGSCAGGAPCSTGASCSGYPLYACFPTGCAYILSPTPGTGLDEQRRSRYAPL